jgi:2-iminobutanoate/2-iminopropanoate deaminase
MTVTDRSWTPVTLADFPPPAGAYSPGVKAGNLMFVSGQVPREPSTGVTVGTDVVSQSRQTLINLERILVAGGATLQHVVSVTVYLANDDDWGAFDAYYRTVFSAPYPTRAVIGANLRGMLVEISAVAYIP